MEANPIVTSASSFEFGHKEPIAQLSWIHTEESQNNYQLISLGNDGLLLVWNFECKGKGKERLHLNKGLSLKSTSIPHNLSFSRSSTVTELGGKLSITFTQDYITCI